MTPRRRDRPRKVLDPQASAAPDGVSHGTSDPSGAPKGGGRRKRRRVVRPGVGGDPIIPGPSADDSDVGWHERAEDDTNDERLRRDVPPHW